MKPRNPRLHVPFIHVRFPALGLAAAVTTSLALSSAHAATWVGDTSQDWNTAANWDSDPGNPTGNFIINSDAAGVFPVIGADSAFAPVDIIIGNAGATGRLDQSSGTLATGAGNWMILGDGGTGSYNLSGGTLNATEVHIARTGTTGTGTVTVGGTGTINTTGATIVADGLNNTATSTGTLNVNSGGTVNSENDLLVAFAGGANTLGTLNIAAGGTVNVASTVERWLIVNMWDATKGVINVNGGTLNLNANTDLRFSTGGYAPGASVGTSTVTLNSGLITGGASSVLDLNQNADNAVNNTFNLNGGTFSISAIISAKTNGTRVFNFNGGLLKATSTNASFFPSNAASAANVRDGGAIIDTNGSNITIGQSLTHSDVGGDAVIDGGLVKNGEGVLSLAGINSYTGNTTVNAGQLTLADNGSIRFHPGAGGVTNKITGTGAVQFDGDFTIDTTGASTTIGDSWTLVDVGTLAEGYGATFTVTGWSEVGSGIWQSPAAPFYRFTRGTGVLSVVDSNDSDGDGLDDLWEDRYFGNNDGTVQPADLVQTAAGDPDGDTYNNASEFAANTAPNNAASSPANTDADGLDDLWEDQYFGDNDGVVEATDLTPQNGTGDPDGDLASNLIEFTNSTTPTSPDSWPDADGDMMNDGWETAFFGNLAKNGTADTDGDGYTDLQEHDAHTNPAATTGTRVSPIWSSLAHRWSFTGNLNDSVGTSHATIVEVGANDVAQGPDSVTMTGGDKAASDYIKLGSNLLPKSTTPVTIEIWAKQNGIKNWSRIFDFHSATNETLFMSWTMGTTEASDRVSFVDAAGDLTIDNGNQPYGLTAEQHIVLVLEPLAGLNSSTRLTVYSAPRGATDLGAAKVTGQTAINLVNFNDALDALGYSPWPDETASATYSEVRIWNGALFGWMREKLHDQGPDDAAIPDADNDFLPDAWEVQYFANTTSAVSLQGNNDGDAFTNVQEYVAGSNPNNAASTPDDTDADGLDDSLEILYFGSVASQTGTGDFDGDGTDNLTEQRLNLLPNDGTSRFAVTSTDGNPADGYTVTWQGVSGLTFSIQRSSSLAAGSWTTIHTVTPGADGPQSFNDPAPLPTGGAFYRVLLRP